MNPTRISAQVSVKHCSLCQGDTEYYCYGCEQDLCIQCKELHVIDLSTKIHIVTSYAEKKKYPPKQVKSSQSQDSKQMFGVRSQDSDINKPCVVPRKSLPYSGHDEIERKRYSGRIYHLRGETVYYKCVLLEGLRHDRKTGHKAVTIRGQSKAEMRGQGLKDLIDDVLAGDLEDRCIIQKTRMTRHMTKVLRYYHRYEQLSKTMETSPVKFLRIMTQKHSPRKDDMKPIINMLVNLMKGIRLVPSGIPRRAGVEDLLTLLSSPLLQKSLSVIGVNGCYHISRVTPDRVWVSDGNNLILTDTATGKKLQSVDESAPVDYGIHTVNSWRELIYIDKERNIKKLCTDMKTTHTLIKYTDKTWEPLSVYYSTSTGDLLVGMYREDTDADSDTYYIGRIMRYDYDNTGEVTHALQHDNTLHDLYVFPIYITENNNGDIVVSDLLRDAVVVTSSKGVHRFSYTGPSSESKLQPEGICTDVLSHILVCDCNTTTIQMFDRDGQFLSYVLTGKTPGMDYIPVSLSYDVYTHVIWVGSSKENRMFKYRYINRHLHLAGTDNKQAQD